MPVGRVLASSEIHVWDEPADHGDGGELRKLEEHENQDDRPQLLALIEAVTDGEGGVDHELGGRNGKDEIAEKLKDDQQRVTAQRGGLHSEERCENIIEKSGTYWKVLQPEAAISSERRPTMNAAAYHTADTTSLEMSS